MTTLFPSDRMLSDGSVSLRPVQVTDADWIANVTTDTEFARFTLLPVGGDVVAHRATVQRADQLRRDGRGVSFVIEDSHQEPLGVVSLHGVDKRAVGEVAYWIKRDARRQGNATRALRLLVSWAMEEVGLQRLILETYVENDASQRTARAAGFGFQRRVRADVRGEEVELDRYILVWT